MLWADVKRLQSQQAWNFMEIFHRLRFGFANADVDSLDADLLQQLMPHKEAQTTRKYINAVQRLRRAKTAEALHVPDVLKVSAGQMECHAFRGRRGINVSSFLKIDLVR